MFPVPRITESFVDRVAEVLGWERYTDRRDPAPGELNADYVASPGMIIELKIFEEEALEKTERQSKIADLYSRLPKRDGIVDLDLERVPDEVRRQLQTIVSRPLQTAVKKASKQIRESAIALRANGPGVLIAVNNGYSYLDAYNFEKLILRRCRNDCSNIDYAACITIDYHQSDFDAFVFCSVRSYTVHGNEEWPEAERFRVAAHDAFKDGMTQMMGDQMNPNLWDRSLGPVTDILFERNGVRYIRRAPYVPDSRFEEI